MGLIGQETGGKYTSYHFDLRGSSVALTNETAQVIERFQYSPYGMLLGGNAAKTPFLFNGMYGVMSDGNGLYYMRARFYSPEIRRFVNQDILLGNIAEGQTLNRYAFVTGNPVSFVDPFGLINWGALGGRVKNNTLRPILVFNWDLNELIILGPGEYSPLIDYDADYIIDFIDDCDKMPRFTKTRNLNFIGISSSGEWELIGSLNPNFKFPIPATLEHIRLIHRIISRNAENLRRFRSVRDYCKKRYKYERCEPECEVDCVPPLWEPDQ